MSLANFVRTLHQLTLIAIINIAYFAIAIQPAWSASFAVRVFDGDNITLVERGIKTKVHLACIDAPELLQTEGEHARKVLQNILDDEEVYVKVFKKDKFGRYIGEVLAGGQNANKVMVSLGLAHYDRIQEKDCQGYAELEAKAQSEHLGVWTNGTDVMLPAQFRRDNKLLGVGY
ncbi:thermonuclease family protein [Pseudanabaena mucicola]|uniref:Thermonuclease family protein n=1 Tax=Pseudanabaena mucicola FACHB-723 TaxID=2692860 RepID=A0ABR7ZWS1_9CYAN|nr:thermonuclease family protein [Pseudanabaena mucicola]MBD2187843.1 thermonuclease family protein [Pseudanabaena mucicola FACHB-723]